MQDNIAVLREWIAGSDNIVFFGGAGVSTESGIPDFRSTDGLYRQEYKYPPETILSHTFFEQNPEEFFRFYRAKPSRTNRFSRTRRTGVSPSLSGKESCAPSSRRTSTGCIRPRAASASLSCTVRSTAAAAPDAASPVPRRPSTPEWACRAARAAACSARRSCSMKSRSPSATSPML